MSWLLDVQTAENRIRPYLDPTPLVRSYFLSERLSHPVYLKIETQNPTGSFKVRPALNGILAQLETCRDRGVVTTSSGNFAQAVAWAGSQLGVSTTIVMTEDTLPYKLERTQNFGGKVVLCGPLFEDRFRTVQRLQQESGAVVLHGFDSIETVQGNGTIALELNDQLIGPFDVIGPASGGGLMSGIAKTLRNLPKPSAKECRISVAQPIQGAALVQSIHEKRRMTIDKVRSVADALVATTPGQIPFDLLMESDVQGVTVSEEAILNAVELLIEDQKLWVEPGGAVSVAAALEMAMESSSKSIPLVCILSGGNKRYE